MKRALISVSNKDGIVEFAKNLIDLGYEIISTGGTFKLLTDSSINAINISEITNFPEILDGRVKTLHPNIHAGILAIDDKKEHRDTLAKLDIKKIDLLVVNLYPFKHSFLNKESSNDDIIENIDIGGPTMLRAAAKNYKYTTVIVDPSDYISVIKELNENGVLSENKRLELARKVFNHTASYDSLISSYFNKITDNKDIFPDDITFAYEKFSDLTYGENPHQKAAFYKEINNNTGQMSNIEQLNGKDLSFNNINDTNAGLELIKEFDEATSVVIKHANASSVASSNTLLDAYNKAFTSDSMSIFGGILVFNRAVDKNLAKEINKIFVEIVLAPSFDDDALNILKEKENLRILKLDDLDKNIDKKSLNFKKVYGGLLVQTNDLSLYNEDNFVLKTTDGASQSEIEDLIFALKVVKHTKSNAIVLAKNKQTLGIGIGQVNRVWATKQAIEHAIEFLGEESLKNASLASDAFFPFTDCIELAAKYGIKSIIQPGGAKRDQEAIDLCNKLGISMFFTNERHFKH